MKILIYIQDDNGKINGMSLESIKGAQDIINNSGGTIIAVTKNSNVADQLKDFNIDDTLIMNSPDLGSYSSLHYIEAMNQIIKQVNPDIIIFGHTYEIRDWVPRLSARLNIPFISDCTGFKYENELSLIRQLYQGKVSADFSIKKFPCIISFQSGSFRSDQIKSGTSNKNTIDIDLSHINSTIHPEEKFQESQTDVDLTQANIIVSIGRGIGKEENINMVRNFAKAIGGSIASSRPIVDSGWLEAYHQIGSSGQTVAPKLYLALGISGAIQHIVGMKGSQNIVVINKDSNAPFFELADYAVVGDILEIIPKLTEILSSN